MSYFQKHRYHLLAFVVLVIIASVSGYLGFTSAPEHLSTSTEENNKKESQNFPSSLQGEGQDEVSLESPNKQTEIIKQNTTTTFTTNTTAVTFQNPTTLTVAGEEYATEFVEGTTVYQLMQILSASSVKPFIFSGKDYGSGMGYFITEINGVKNNPKTGEYWIYYINGKSAQMGISNYIINKGDKIEWKYENSNM